MNNEDKAEVFDSLFMSGAMEAFVLEDLKVSYQVAEPDDWKYKDALREVIKAYSLESEYNKWLASVTGGEDEG